MEGHGIGIGARYGCSSITAKMRRRWLAVLSLARFLSAVLLPSVHTSGGVLSDADGPLGPRFFAARQMFAVSVEKLIK